jgi:hypothetical protein
MMKKLSEKLSLKKSIWVMFCLLFFVFTDPVFAQTTLVKGEIVFTGFNSNDNSALANEFSFVILRAGGVVSGTVINFSDNGWNTPSSVFGTTEGVVSWTATSALPQFTEVTIKVNTSGNGITSVSSGTAAVTTINFILSQAGDVIFAYQGSLIPSSLIAGIQYNFESGGSGANPSTLTAWDDFTGTTPYPFTSSRSGIPPTLTNGDNAIMVVDGSVAPYIEYDNGKYNCTGSSSATLGDIRSAINDRTNWIKQNTTKITLPSACSFVIGASPSITVQPNNVDTCPGNSCKFSITAANATSYQWQEYIVSWNDLSNTGIYSGVTAATLIISNVAGLNGRQYRCIASGSTAPPATSNAGTLTVKALPSISSNPSSVNVCPGAATFFKISATGTGITYQWQVDQGLGFKNLSNASIYSGVTTDSMHISSTSLGMDNYLFRCEVTGTCPPLVNSNAATLTVAADLINPVISNCPSDVFVNVISGTCSAVATWILPTASDNCSLASFTSNFNSGNTFSLGSTGIIYTATDGSGNTSSCNFKVKVADNENPKFSSCPSDTTIINSNFVYTIPTGTDNCSASTVTRVTGLGSGANFPLGTTIETYVLTDTSGNTDTCRFSVTVNPTGIGSVSSKENPFFIYPNPASGVINIKSTQLDGSNVTLEIIDLSGRMIRKMEIRRLNEAIDIHDISEGLYFAKIITPKNTFVHKIAIKYF